MRRDQRGLYTNNFGEDRKHVGTGKHSGVASSNPGLYADQNYWANMASSISTKNMGQPVQWIPMLEIHGAKLCICCFCFTHMSMTKFTL